LALNCYPDSLERVDKVLRYATTKTTEYESQPDLHSSTTQHSLLALLLAPLSSYTNILTVLALPHYNECLQAQTYATRRSVSTAIVHSILSNDTKIDSVRDVDDVLTLLKVIIEEGTQQPGYGSGQSGVGRRSKEVETDNTIEEQGLLARLIHNFRAEDGKIQLQVCEKLISHQYLIIIP